MSSHRESGDQAHVHDEAEEPVLAQADDGELGDAELEQASGGSRHTGGVNVAMRDGSLHF